MADREEPKTHVEDQDVKGVRKQPLSPQHEGIDPLTESDTLKPRHDDKGDSEKAERTEESEAVERLDNGEVASEDQAQADTVADQKAVEADTRPASEKEDETAPGKADDPTPDAGEKAEDQEPHTDAGNTSPANRTSDKTDSKSKAASK